jgi:hypothetical protein
VDPFIGSRANYMFQFELHRHSICLFPGAWIHASRSEVIDSKRNKVGRSMRARDLRVKKTQIW